MAPIKCLSGLSGTVRTLSRTYVERRTGESGGLGRQFPATAVRPTLDMRGKLLNGLSGCDALGFLGILRSIAGKAVFFHPN